MDVALFVMSGLGVLLLISAHAAVSCGLSKSNVSGISALGAAISTAAAFGMGIWPVFALNVAWMCISVWGMKIPEAMTSSRAADLSLVAIAATSILLWAIGPDQVAWAASVIYVCGWLCFSLGLVSRRAYLAACIFAGVAVVPALWILNAHAFAFNEAFGVAVGIYGIARGWRSQDAGMALSDAPVTHCVQG